MVERFAFQHLAGVIVLGPSGDAHVGVPDDADTALVRWVTAVAEYVVDGYGLDEAQALARQRLLPRTLLESDDGRAECSTVAGARAGVPVEVIRRRQDELGLGCCPGATPAGCVRTINERRDLRVVLIAG